MMKDFFKRVGNVLFKQAKKATFAAATAGVPVFVSTVAAAGFTAGVAAAVPVIVIAFWGTFKLANITDAEAA